MNVEQRAPTDRSEAGYWGRRPRDWAEAQEATALPLYEEVLARLAVGAGTRLLDIGCGSGMALELAARRGAELAGIDQSPGLIAIARDRAPRASVALGDMASLPFGSREFDVVTGFNAFQYAGDVVAALREAKRVCREDGRVAIGVWGSPDETEARAYLETLASLMPAAAPRATGPFALSAEGALADLATWAGLRPVDGGSVSCPWDYPDLETALRGLLSSGGAARAIEHVGEDRVRSAVAEAIAPFRQASGRYVMQNRFRFLIATTS